MTSQLRELPYCDLGGGGGVLSVVCTGRLLPKVQTLTPGCTNFYRNGAPSIYSIGQKLHLCIAQK